MSKHVTMENKETANFHITAEMRAEARKVTYTLEQTKLGTLSLKKGVLNGTDYFRIEHWIKKLDLNKEINDMSSPVQTIFLSDFD